MVELLVPVFRVADGEVAASWYARLGFVVDGVHRFEPHLPRYTFVRRGDVCLHLSEHLGDARPDTLAYFYVDDVQAIATEFGVPVVQQPWAREIELTDPDGNRLRIGTAISRHRVELEISSTVATSRAEVWSIVSTMSGVNDELGPWIRMTHPSDRSSLSTLGSVDGRVLVRSWVLVLGVLPIDRYALALERVDNGHGFVEESSSWLQRRWHHQRVLVDEPGGCRVTDRLVVEPRLALTRPLVAAIVRLLFRHRHRRLGRRFGQLPPPSQTTDQTAPVNATDRCGAVRS